MHSTEDGGIQERSPVLGTQQLAASDAEGKGNAKIKLIRAGAQVVEWLAGDIDVADSEDLRGFGDRALAEPGVDTLVIDCSRVTFLDATALGALVQLRNDALAAGKCLMLRDVSRQVDKLLALTSLDGVFESA